MKRITYIALGLTFVACSSSDEPTREEYDDTAQAIASSTSTGSGGGDVASMSDSVTISLGTLPLGISLQANGEFQGSRAGLDYSYRVTCKNAAGTTLTACNATTNEAAVDVTWAGSLASPSLDASVSRDGSWQVTGLQGDTATFSGDSSFSFDATLRSVFRPGVTVAYSFDANASYNAVLISTQDRQAIGGSAELSLDVKKLVSGTNNDVDKSFEIDAQLTFQADRTASLVLDGDQRYTINLQTGAVVRVN